MTALSDTMPSPSSCSDWILPVAGDVWHRRYRIGQPLGRGGMSVVVQATDLTLDRDVAIKCLHHSLADDESLRRFWDEARTTACMNSEHAVRIYDIGQSPSGAPFLCLELLHGTDLSLMMQERGRLCGEDVVFFLFQACEALAEAHALGIVHCDLKPSNLFVTRRLDGSACVKIIDFGIAQCLARRQSSSSRTLGSPRYMAPEQLLAPERVGGQADIWALGLILYELASGALPFRNEAPCHWRLAREIFPPLSALCSELPKAVDRVVEGCLRTDPAERYADILEFARALTDAFPGTYDGQLAKICRIREVVRSSRPPRLDAEASAESSRPWVRRSPHRCAEEGLQELTVR